MMNILKFFQKRGISLPVPKWIFRFLMVVQAGTRGASLGTRILVMDEMNRVFLVRHSYMAGWYLPGGGVERGEVPLNAVMRELEEEAGMGVHGPDVALLGVYLNDRAAVPDYVLLYQVRNWRWLSVDGLPPDAASEDGEIVEADFFALDALPKDISPATRRRLDEIQGKCPPDTLW